MSDLETQLLRSNLVFVQLFQCLLFCVGSSTPTPNIRPATPFWLLHGYFDFRILLSCQWLLGDLLPLKECVHCMLVRVLTYYCLSTKSVPSFHFRSLKHKRELFNSCLGVLHCAWKSPILKSRRSQNKCVLTRVATENAISYMFGPEPS